MWSCGFKNKRPVELVFHLPSTAALSSESHGLSKITVWNYNRGIKVSYQIKPAYLKSPISLLQLERYIRELKQT